MDAIERQVRILRTKDRREPFTIWLNKLKDQRAKQKVQARIARVRIGNFGHTRSLGGGVHELKVDYGPGYRVYFGLDGPLLIILLCGGDKRTQAADIHTAKTYWSQYQPEVKREDR